MNYQKAHVYQIEGKVLPYTVVEYKTALEAKVASAKFAMSAAEKSRQNWVEKRAKAVDFMKRPVYAVCSSPKLRVGRYDPNPPIGGYKVLHEYEASRKWFIFIQVKCALCGHKII